MSESFKKGIVERIFRNFLDIMVLRFIKEKPRWGYKIIKDVEELHGIKLRHGALYPLLNSLEENGFLRVKKEMAGGRIRKIYEITSKGIQLTDAYNDFLNEQIQKLDIQINQ